LNTGVKVFEEFDAVYGLGVDAFLELDVVVTDSELDDFFGVFFADHVVDLVVEALYIFKDVLVFLPAKTVD
jgi:hypothetical protein